MNNKPGFKNKTTTSASPYDKEEMADVIISREKLVGIRDIKSLKLAEITTPQPYSVSALCKLYEHFQLN